MKCPYCNKNHSDSAKFCEETGLALVQVCENPKCEGKGKPLSFDVKFCPYCGTYLKSASNRQKEYVKNKTPKEQEQHLKKEFISETENDGRGNKEKINPFSLGPKAISTPHNCQSLDDNGGCWIKGMKIFTGIITFLGGLYFWFVVLKSCSGF